ncbi:MAG TPA: hypothetical protein VGB54_12125 [Allosphingosinicella sp.]|jgi:hypothetical protein
MLRISVGLAALLLAGCGGGKEPLDGAERNGAGNRSAAADTPCASQQTYDRLKELAFDEAARIRGDDAQALDQIAGSAVVRMENPVVRSRDEELNVTTCAGRFILELPPGNENAFDGERRLSADVEYAAQTAADGSGLVYQMEGAEPIIYKLATVGGLARAENQRVTIPAPSGPPGAERQIVTTPPPQVAQAQPAPAAEPGRKAEAAPPTRPVVRPAPPREASASASPSFNCRVARSRSERMVCSSGSLAALDRRMSSMFYSALAEADGATRAQLRRSRDRFLSFRERCGSEACVAQAYRDRMDEISDMVRGD